MPRKRMIDPDIWEDEKFAKLDYAGRLFFIGLITQANDYGKLRGNTQLLKSRIFPYDANGLKIESYLEELNELRMICIYMVNNETFIKIRNWNKYQVLMHPSKDNIPEPSREFLDGFKTDSRGFQPQVKLSQVKLREVKLNNIVASQQEEVASQPQQLEPEISFTEFQTEVIKALNRCNIINFTSLNKKNFKSMLDNWELLYKGYINLQLEILRADGWLIENKIRKSNYGRFLGNWFKKTLDKVRVQTI